MSRRSRRRGSPAGTRWLGKLGIGLVLAGVLGFGGLYVAVRGYLRSEGFRQFLSAEAGRLAKVKGEFTPFRWEGLAVDTSAFEGVGEEIVRELRLEGLHTEIGLSGLKNGVWEIQASRAQRIEVLLDAREKAVTGGVAAAAPVTSAPPKAKAGTRSWLPSEVEIQGVDVGELVVKAMLDGGPASADGMRVRAEPTGGKQSYRIEVIDGTVRLPYELVPEIRLERAKLRYQNRQLFLNSLTAKAWNQGRLNATGEWEMSGKRYALEGKVSGVKCDEVFSEDWAKRFAGDMGTDFSLNNLGGEMVARGSLKVRNGTLTALPMLDALAAYADTRRFRILNLSEAHTEWRWKKGEILLSDLVLESEGLVRLEGTILIRGRTLDGTFRLGLVPGTLARIPGAETDVFSPGERGLMWSPLRITGTLDDPKEDLTDRLIDAAGARMFDIIPETGERAIKFTRAVLGDSPDKAVEKGIKIIEEGTRAIDDVSGILDGFFGSSRRVPPVQAPAPTPIPRPEPDVPRTSP